MIRSSRTRLAVVLAALASSAVAVDYEENNQAVSHFAQNVRDLRVLQAMCPTKASFPQASLLQVADMSAKDFTLQDLSGKSFTLSSLRGKIVLLDFWTTWCPPCRASSPFLQELQFLYGSKGLVVLGVNQGEPLDKVKNYVTEKGLTYRIVLDPSQSVSELYRVEGFPTFVLIGADGKILWRQEGYAPSSQGEFKKAIEKAIVDSAKGVSI
jgi:thiol-disulfide isomerase/thioredoxin